MERPRQASEVGCVDRGGPPVLVGHSMGGLHVRAFARKFPDSVAGIVLVDATHQDQWDFEPKRFWQPPGAASTRFMQPESRTAHG